MHGLFEALIDILSYIIPSTKKGTIILWSIILALVLGYFFTA